MFDSFIYRAAAWGGTVLLTILNATHDPLKTDMLCPSPETTALAAIIIRNTNLQTTTASTSTISTSTETTAIISSNANCIGFWPMPMAMVYWSMAMSIWPLYIA